MSRKTGGGGSVHVMGKNSMAMSGLSCEKAFVVGARWVILCIKGCTKQFPHIVGLLSKLQPERPTSNVVWLVKS